MHLDLLTAAQEHRDIWARSVQAQLDKAKEEHANLSLYKPSSVKCARLQSHIQHLLNDLNYIESTKHVNAAYSHADSRADVPC